MHSNQEQDKSILCQCGRRSDVKHCPTCGARGSSYALAKKATIQDRSSGELKEVNVYRCRSCNSYYNDDDWQNNCKAPSIENRQAKKLEEHNAIREELSAKALRGDDFDHNDKMRFKKYVGVGYDEFIMMIKLGKKHQQTAMAQTKINQEPIKQSEPPKQYTPKPAPPSSVDGFKEAGQETKEDLEDYLKDA